MSTPENGTWTQYQKLVLRLLEQHDEKLEALRAQLAESGSDRASLNKNLASLKNDVDVLLGLVRDGSRGETPILTRIDHLEMQVKDLEDNEVVAKQEAKELLGFKRTLFISLFGIAITICWNLVQYFLGK